MHPPQVAMVSLPLDPARPQALHEPLRVLAKALARIPLFESSAMNGGLSADALHNSHASWFGVGLSGRRLSQGVPVDILQMVFAQEIVRRSLGLSRSFALIADSNAFAAGHPAAAIAVAKERIEWTLLALARQFRFPLEVLPATALASPRLARVLVDKVPASNPYVAHQVAQMQLMRLAGAGVKIGWAVRGFHNDERRFDHLHDRSFPARLAYIYTRGGRSLSAARPRCSPYVCERRDDRLLLEPGERLGAKLDRFGHDRRHPLVRGYRRLLAHLARAHRQLVGPDRPWAPEERLQFVVDHLR
ncbi:MAG: hypothetical protein JXP73_03590 [Deltaproteobacteria bacterium]|nr:hypothetical protein [Deltaproteobacteria bacterium]